jgi:hypothetical protein
VIPGVALSVGDAVANAVAAATDADGALALVGVTAVGAAVTAAVLEAGAAGEHAAAASAAAARTRLVVTGPFMVDPLRAAHRQP